MDIACDVVIDKAIPIHLSAYPSLTCNMSALRRQPSLYKCVRLKREQLGGQTRALMLPTHELLMTSMIGLRPRLGLLHILCIFKFERIMQTPTRTILVEDLIQQ